MELNIIILFILLILLIFFFSEKRIKGRNEIYMNRKVRVNERKKKWRLEDEGRQRRYYN